jgi:hypothetical protein
MHVDYQDLLRMKKELKPFHKYNLFHRMLERTKGDILIVFNNYSGNYEVHSIKSQLKTADSQNAVFHSSELLNAFLIKDYLSRRVEKFGVDIESEHMKLNTLYDRHDEKTYTSRAMDVGRKSVERSLGRKI